MLTWTVCSVNPLPKRKQQHQHQQRRERWLRSWLKHERQTVRMVLAETFRCSSALFPPKFKEEWVERHEQHDALQRQNTARTREATYCTSKTSVAGDTAFFSLYDGEDAVWGTRPASLAKLQRATGAGSAAHRGAHAGDVRARPVSRRSCAADGGPVGGCGQDRRLLRARAGHQSAQDLVPSSTFSCCPPRHSVEVPWVSPSSVPVPQMAEQLEDVRRRALFIGRDGKGTPHTQRAFLGNTPPAQGGIQILGKVDDVARHSSCAAETGGHAP